MLKIKQNIQKLINSFKRFKIRAVHEDDLMEMLKSMGILEKVEKGEFVCVCCGETININNIEVFFLKHGEKKFVCSKSICISNISKL